MSRTIPPSLLSSLPKDSLARAYPFLAYLVSGWLHQDYSEAGDTLDEILDSYEQTLSVQEKQETTVDINSFLTQYPSDREAAAAFEAVFQPEVSVEGWEGLTTRQWLLHVAECLRGSDASA